MELRNVLGGFCAHRDLDHESRDKGTEGQRDGETEGQRDRGTEGQRDRGTVGPKGAAIGCQRALGIGVRGAEWRRLRAHQNACSWELFLVWQVGTINLGWAARDLH
jgi:hypothetical protein